MKQFRLFFALLLLLATQSVRADITVANFSDSRSPQVTQQRVIDDEGHYCALIKLKTSVEGIVVDGTQARERRSEARQTVFLVEPQNQFHPDEVWVYISARSNRLRLFHPEYGGMKEGSLRVKNGYYFFPEKLHPELTYKMEITLDEATDYVPANTPSFPTLVEAQFSTDNDANKMNLDGSRVRSEKKYLITTGEHKFKTYRLLYHTDRQRAEAVAGQPFKLSSSISRIPINAFGGIEMGKPTSYSDFAYGVRAGIVCYVGLYFSYFTTLGNGADGDAIKPERLQYEPIAPYSDPHCQYKQWSTGLILNCVGALHVYAGVGQATRSVNWLGLDEKRHEHTADHYQGFSWEAGLMYNVNRFYLSAGADCTDGSWGGRVGAGLFLNLVK